MRQALGWPASTWGEFPACAQGLKARGSQLPLELRRQTREQEFTGQRPGEKRAQRGGELQRPPGLPAGLNMGSAGA